MAKEFTELNIKPQKIEEKNKFLGERMEDENWGIFYNRRADMITIGADFPKGSFYYPMADGFMLRIDESYKIYGFAIENAKFFIKEHPEFMPLIFVIYPWTKWIFKTIYFLIYHTYSGIIAMRSILRATERYASYQIRHAQ